METADKYIPHQVEGRQTDFADSVSCADMDAAHQQYLMARAKLLDVGNWHLYCGPGTATFILTDNEGRQLHRSARHGDHFSIDLPATPGSSAGGGLEWVLITDIIEQGDRHSAEEFTVMIVRPVPDPRKRDGEVAHFFSEKSTSTFIVARYGLRISAEVHGRNELPNNGDVNLHDMVRNTVIALSARVGLSGPQWKKLVTGVLKER